MFTPFDWFLFFLLRCVKVRFAFALRINIDVKKN